jgi:hypothetical protein
LESALLPASYFGAAYRFPAYNPWGSGPWLERSVDKVHLSSYTCKQLLLSQEPASGYGETAFAGGQVSKGKSANWTASYYEQVYQFPSVGPAVSFYQENYVSAGRCKDVTAKSFGKTSSLTVRSMRTGHVDGGPAFFELTKTEYTGFPDDVNFDEWVVVGRDVYNVDAFYPVGQAHLTPNAATLALITRVEAAR